MFSDTKFYYLEKIGISILWVFMCINSFNPDVVMLGLWDAPIWLDGMMRLVITIAGPAIIFKQKPEEE